MTAKMAAWQIDKVEKMQDLSEEIMTGINDSLDFMAFNVGATFDPYEMIIMGAFIDMCANNIELCGAILRYLKKWMKEEALQASDAALSV